MKPYDAVKAKRQALQVFQDFVQGIPPLSLRRIVQNDPQVAALSADFIAEVGIAGQVRFFSVAVKASGQPRSIREAAGQLRRRCAERPDIVPIVMAPFLSETARRVSKDEKNGYLDFHGNAHVAFDAVFIEREVAGKPEPERRSLRSLRSLFKPQSARVVRLLLAEPSRHWRVIELSHAARVSVGLVGNIRTELRERCWADPSDQGFYLTDPDALLDAWADEYDPTKSREVRRYTSLVGDTFAERLMQLSRATGSIALSSFSAAEWWAPHVHQESTFFYADVAGLADLERVLELKPATTAANVIIRIPDEPGILDDAIRLEHGLCVTRPVQTYLDLLRSGDNGQAGAEHLRGAVLNWPSNEADPMKGASQSSGGFMLRDDKTEEESFTAKRNDDEEPNIGYIQESR